MEDRRDEMVSMQAKFSEMYFGTGLIGVDDVGVQLDEEYFKSLFDDYETREVDHHKRLTAEYKGCEFFCLSWS